MYVSFPSKFNRICSIILLSEIIPIARIKIKIGIGFLTLGIIATILLFFCVSVDETTLIEKTRIGLEVSSETDLISDEWLYVSFTLSLIYIVLLANVSWGIIDFSFPSMTKYPP